MRRMVWGTCLAVASLLFPGAAQADSFTLLPDGSLVVDAIFSTHGTFTCRVTVSCSGTGTDTITFGSGDSQATVTFTGVSQDIQVGNHAIPASLGTFESSFTPGFVFPTKPSPYSPILQFDLFFNQTSPAPANRRKVWVARGGGTMLRLGPSPGLSVSFSTPTGPLPPGFEYSAIEYTVHATPIALTGNGSASMIAHVGLVPEPATLVLLGTGLTGAALSRRRRSRAT